jgi:hypothetical protein
MKIKTTSVILYSWFTKLSEFHSPEQVHLTAMSHEPVVVYVRAHLCFADALQALDVAKPMEREIVLNTIPCDDYRFLCLNQLHPRRD